MSLVAAAAAAAAAGSSFVGVPRMSLCCARVLPSCSADVSVMAPSLRRRNAMYVLESFPACRKSSSRYFRVFFFLVAAPPACFKHCRLLPWYNCTYRGRESLYCVFFVGMLIFRARPGLLWTARTTPNWLRGAPSFASTRTRIGWMTSRSSSGKWRRSWPKWRSPQRVCV